MTDERLVLYSTSLRVALSTLYTNKLPSRPRVYKVGVLTMARLQGSGWLQLIPDQLGDGWDQLVPPPPTPFVTRPAAMVVRGALVRFLKSSDSVTVGNRFPCKHRDTLVYCSRAWALSSTSGLANSTNRLTVHVIQRDHTLHHQNRGAKHSGANTLLARTSLLTISHSPLSPVPPPSPSTFLELFTHLREDCRNRSSPPCYSPRSTVP
jgi:hypothetical protein